MVCEVRQIILLTQLSGCLTLQIELSVYTSKTALRSGWWSVPGETHFCIERAEIRKPRAFMGLSSRQYI